MREGIASTISEQVVYGKFTTPRDNCPGRFGAALRLPGPATQWVKPGLIGCVKHLRGEEKLRHASTPDFRES